MSCKDKMNIGDALNKLGVSYTYQGELEVDSLGLINDDTGLSVCAFVDDVKYMKDISRNVRVILTKKGTPIGLFNNIKGICFLDNPRETFFRLHNMLAKDKEYVREIRDTKIGTGCDINNLACVAKKNVIIGDNVIIEEFVSIKENTVLENNVIIRAGAIIGGEGFEFKRSGDKLFGVSHVGGVIIREGAEIQQNSTVDKAVYPWNDTIIGRYSRIDNLVHIAHGVKIHDRVMVIANTCVAGRAVLEDDVWVGPVSAVRNGITIGEKGRISMGSVVTRNVEPGQAVTGNFAIEHQEFLKNLKK